MFDESQPINDTRETRRALQRPRLVAATVTGPVYVLHRPARVYPPRSGLGLLQELAVRSRDGEASVASSLARTVRGEAAADLHAQASLGLALGLVNATPIAARAMLMEFVHHVRMTGTIEGLETLAAATINAAWPAMRTEQLRTSIHWLQDAIRRSESDTEAVVAVVDPARSRFTYTTVSTLARIDLSSWLAEVELIPEGWRNGAGLPGGGDRGGFGRQLPGGLGDTGDPAGSLGLGRGPGSGNGLFGPGGPFGDAPFGQGSRGSSADPLGGLGVGRGPGSGNGLFGAGGPFGDAPFGAGSDSFTDVLGKLGFGGLSGGGMPGSPFGEGSLTGSPGDDDIARGNQMKTHGQFAEMLGLGVAGIAAGVAPSPYGKAFGIGFGLGFAAGGADEVARGQAIVDRGEAKNREAAATPTKPAVVVSSDYEIDDQGVMRDKNGNVVVDAQGNVKHEDGTWTDKDGKPIPDPTKPGQLPDYDGQGGGNPTTQPLDDGAGGVNPVWLPDYDGASGGHPTSLPDSDGSGGGNPLTLWDENGGGGHPTTIGVGARITSVEGAGMRAGIVQVGARTFSF